MTVVEFESWLSGDSLGAYRISTVQEHSDRNQLRAMRELESLMRERKRLSHASLLEDELDPVGGGDDSTAMRSDTRSRLNDSTRRIAELTNYLQSAGWDVEKWST